MTRFIAIITLPIIITLILTGCGPKGGDRAPAIKPEADSGTVRIDGFDLPYLTEGSGPPCIVVGSRLYHSRIFSPRFKGYLRCTFMDTRVFVPSAPVDSTAPYSIETAVEDIEAVRKALHLPKVVLVGHSIFGTVVIAFARKYPGSVSRVIAIGTPTEWTPAYMKLLDDYWNSQASAGRKALQAKNRAALTPDSLQKLSPTDAFLADAQADNAKRWCDSTYSDLSFWPGVQVNPSQLEQLFDLKRGYSLFKDTTKIQPPIFLAIGRFDFYGGAPTTAWDGRHGLFRDLTVQVFEHSGHTPQLEEADKFDARVFEWLKR